ncbi:MAG: aryl-sulfate sulfotransferase [Planctomycetota bacterium]
MRTSLLLLAILIGCGGGDGDLDLGALRAQFQLVVPRDGGLAVHRRQEVRWRSFPSAESYTVEVWADANRTVLHERREDLTATTCRIETDMLDGREYWVEVHALSRSGQRLGTTVASRMRVRAIPDWMPDFETPHLDTTANQGGFVLTNLIHRNQRTRSPERIPVMLLFNGWGELVWWYLHPDPGTLTATKITPRGTIYYLIRQPGSDGLTVTTAYEIDWDGNVLWQSTEGERPHHEISDHPDGVMYLTYEVETYDGVDYEGDGIQIVDRDTNELLWEWLIFDYFDPRDYQDFPEINNIGLSRLGLDWSHSNAVVWDEARGLIWVSVRHLDRLIGIDYPSGDIVITIGDEGLGGEGLIGHQHAPEIQPDGSILLWDNGNGKNPQQSRAVQFAFDEMAGTIDVVFEWIDNPPFYDPAVGDANRLPNGNTLITAGVSGRLIEVTPAGRIVWEKRFDDGPEYWQYRAELVPDELVPAAIRALSD